MTGITPVAKKTVKDLVPSKRAAFTLAEVFSPHCAGRRKIAFTLAEVLITLGIIGIVAAMTMPVLIDKHNKKVFVTQLKKGVNVIENSVRRFMFEENLEMLSADDWQLYYSQIPKYLSANKASESNLLYKNYKQLFRYGNFYVLNDGITFTPWNGLILIDVNGDKNPNLPGRDIFLFEFKNTGFVDYEKMISEINLETMNKILGIFDITWNKMPPCNELGDKMLNDIAVSSCGGDKDCIENIENIMQNPDPLIKLIKDLPGMMACFTQVVNDGWEMKY